ncbi:MAG TPA: hypothetical protein VGC77_21495 [Rhodopseudomonas sp.]|uniref:hypothetical protein n=1 Tax=Rhodopseudomonas sp. TaxID=1078 RepID=UPI002ED86CF4
MSWSAAFSPPIPLPDGGELRTLHNARAFLLALPPSEHQAPRWQTVIEVVLLVGGNGGPTDFARIGVMQALYPRGEPVYHTDRKDRPWGRRRLARDR